MKTSIFSAIVSFAVALILCLILIPALRKWKAGQNILSYVKEHKGKSGTPTMGGLAFMIATVAVCAVFVRTYEKRLLVTLGTGLAYMLVGLLDDVLKCKHKENLGLKAWQKMLFQILVASFVAVYAYFAGYTKVYLPFSYTTLNVGVWMIPFIVFVFVATVNAVNLTDGLDGLASGVSIPYFATLGILIFLQTGANSFTVLCFCLVGSLLAYLLFNVSPASVFMGDTGSLALGGFVACIGIFTGNALYIPVLGVMFVISVISVVIQVIYYKVTGGKRVFLMAPIHHHFQQKGFSESKITYAYAMITALIGGACVLALI